MQRETKAETDTTLHIACFILIKIQVSFINFYDAISTEDRCRNRLLKLKT